MEDILYLLIGCVSAVVDPLANTIRTTFAHPFRNLSRRAAGWLAAIRTTARIRTSLRSKQVTDVEKRAVGLAQPDFRQPNPDASPASEAANPNPLAAQDGSGMEGQRHSASTNRKANQRGRDDKSAPNISLNIHGGSKTGELVVAALFGTVLQVGMLVFCGFTIYYPSFRDRFHKDGRRVQQYGFPTMASGTIILVIGMIICSFVVEQRTREMKYVWKPEMADKQGDASNGDGGKKAKIRVLWLQKSHTVSDQVFDSFALFRKYEDGPRDHILTSRRLDNPSDNGVDSGMMASQHAEPRTSEKRTVVKKIAANRMEALTILGVFLGLSGFILQFEGLRAVNWSASIAQLVCTLLMTMWRAWVRRGLIAMPIPKRVREHHEMDWLALRIAKWDEPPQDSGPPKDSGFWPKDHQAFGDYRTNGSQNERLSWEIYTGAKNVACVSEQALSLSEKAQYALNVRRRLGQLTKWTGISSLGSTAVAVAKSIEVVMNTLVNDERETNFVWFLKVQIDGEEAQISFQIDKPKSKWKIDATYIEAALSLWIFHIRENEADQKSDDKKGSDVDWLREDVELNRAVVQILGPDTPSQRLQRDINWWIGEVINKNDGDVTGPLGFIGVESAPGNLFRCRL
jgi:hypothetical protein